jgi:chemotaxis family two-component system sensor kinase Cph1
MGRLAHPPLDLSGCDREPIHIPGSIQGHGALVAFSPSDLAVHQVSANLDRFVGVRPRDALGRPLEQLIGPEACALAAAAIADEPQATQHAFRGTINGRSLDASVHRSGDLAILELEPAVTAASEALAAFRTALVVLQRSTTLDSLCAAAAQRLRAMTGFDRVMVYRFEDEGHGQVIAEARSEELDPYLGRHYPASDIPQQARRLYLLNWIRVIPDVAYAPVPLVSAAEGAPALDLSFAFLRSVSPVHIEYLHNMGVAASMSVSLVCGGRLWGLLACHHRQPRSVSIGVRAACEVMGRLFSLQIEALDEIELRSERERLAGSVASVGAAMQEDQDGWAAALLRQEGELLRIMGASGAAVCEGSRIGTVGSTPPVDEITGLIDWLYRTGVPDFQTHALATLYPPAQRFSALASGLVAISVPGPERACVLWFRQEILKTVTWAGDPSKPAEDGERIGPRRSFAAWREIVRYTSAPFSVAQFEVAQELRRRAIEVDLQRQIALAQRAIAARENVLAIVSHDLRTPLNAVQLSAARLRQEHTDERTTRSLNHIVSATESMTGLISDLLDFSAIDSGRFQIERSRYRVVDLVSDVLSLLTPLAAAKSIELTWRGDTELAILADHRRLLQVFSNLGGNAIKFTPPGGSVTIEGRAEDGSVRFAVSDNGPGIRPENLPSIFDRYWKAGAHRRGGGVGLGLYVAKGIVAAHGGRLWVESTFGQGATFYFTIPILIE